jgi:membrane-bound lytic murein transglycosylase D
MPVFEEIFESYGVPREVSRLVFVESLFNERAFSKSGAAGLWQFMPGTARHFMTVNHQIDQRYDPILSTHGAARLLLKNYQILGSWPLAINAYNSGAANLQRAITTLGSRDISRIITNYKGGSYAFASRNFYPSFLAALEVYEKYKEELTDAVQPLPEKTQTVSDYDTHSPERVIQYPSPLQSRIKTTDISTSLQ